MCVSNVTTVHLVDIDTSENSCVADTPECHYYHSSSGSHERLSSKCTEIQLKV